jgi:Predicted integral membrane protein
MAHLHVIAGAEAHPAHPTIRTITVADLFDALAAAGRIFPPCRATRCFCA